MRELYILSIAHDQVDDVLFVQALARTLAKAGRALPPMLIVHGSGERAERQLEAEGWEVERREGRLTVHTPGQARIVEQAIRESNRKLVSVLNDAVVHAVGLQGTDRRLLQAEEGGPVAAPKAQWIVDLARRGAVPILSALAAGREGAVRETDAAEVAAALVQGIGQGDVTIVFFSAPNRPGEAERPVEATLAQIEAAGMLPDLAPIRHAAGAGIPALVAPVNSFVTPDGVRGTRLVT